MEGPISKFMHVQQPESYWHQAPNNAAFKSPDLIELNSDTERSSRNVEPLNYSSSQEEAETEDDAVEAANGHKDSIPGIPGVYDVTSNDEESCHLLQTEDDSESSHSEHAWNSSASDSSRSSSSNGATISEGEGNEEHRNGRMAKRKTMENYWDMSSEQEKYYTDQFLTLQPDLKGLVNGIVAKGFFEKSKLPSSELREIWQLADITKDGCLDLSEFKMAMHLVVLRRHGLPIPSHFYNRQADFSLSSSGPSSLFKLAGRSKSKSTPRVSRSNEKGVGTSTQQSPLVNVGSSSDPKALPSQAKRPSKEWTTFENEPVNFSSTCDTSGLVAPVPVRLKTPEDKLILSGLTSSSASKAQHLQLKAIQRPKLSGHHPKVSSGIAPPPPPRRKTHVRSSSLDLNRLTTSSEIPLPPTMNGGDIPQRNFLSPCHQGGAFSVYRKPSKPATIHEPENIPSTSEGSGIEQELTDLKYENDLLSRMTAQLLEQLANVQTRRQSVAYKINQLHGNMS